MLAIVVVLHVVLVASLAASLNIWIDEAYTLQSTGDGIASAFRRSIDFELQPPLYFLLLTVWRVINGSLFFARAFSIICTTLTVILVGGLVRRYIPAAPAAMVAAMVAFSPVTVYAAIEARHYGLTLLLSALLLKYFHDGYVSSSTTKAARWRHAATAVTALYTNYALGFLLVAGGVTLLMLRKLAATRSYLGHMMAVAAFFAPMATTTVQQVNIVSHSALQPQTFFEAARGIWGRACRLIFPSDAGILDQFSRLAAWVFIPLSVLATLLRDRKLGASRLAPAIFAAVAGFFFVRTGEQFGSDFVRFYHLTPLYLPFVLAAFSFLDFLGGRRATAWVATISLGFAAVSLYEVYSPLAKYGDWIRVSRYIESHEASREPILVFKAEFALPMRHHYSGRNEIVPLPRAMSDDHYDPTEMVLSGNSDIVSALSARVGGSRRFWLVTSFTTPFRGIDFRGEILEDFVTMHCKVLHERSFNEARVRLLELRSETNALDMDMATRRESKVPD